MENYKVDITNSAQKEIKNLDSQAIKRIVEKLKSLKENPFPSGCKKLIARVYATLKFTTILGFPLF